MYAYAWKQGLKTTYYLRSRPATKIARAAQATTPVALPQPVNAAAADTADAAARAAAEAAAAEALACSLENPESCEACQ